jgi:DNA-binding response OmpR family regulator
MGPPRTILVVEDDIPLRQFFRTALTLAGYEVREAGDGYEALKLLDAQSPDLVVLDLGLPVFSGHAVLDELAAQADTRHIPVVIVTGAASAKTDQLHAECVLTKPITSDRLLDVVRTCLAGGRHEPAPKREEES